MQKYKKNFSDISYSNVTTCNFQKCIRLNDFDIIGDGIHHGSFTMIGMFSFRDWSMEKTIKFWMEFIQDDLGLKIDQVTIHPDKIKEWKRFYPTSFNIKDDIDCSWSDGEIGGYCTEFYSSGIEIGNIVNPLNTCIDVGFGFERLDKLINGTITKSRVEELIEMSKLIIDSGVVPKQTGPGYILKKILREIVKLNGIFDHPLYHQEILRQKNNIEKYERLKKKHINKSKEWWYSTYGIDI